MVGFIDIYFVFVILLLLISSVLCFLSIPMLDGSKRWIASCVFYSCNPGLYCFVEGDSSKRRQRSLLLSLLVEH